MRIDSSGNVGIGTSSPSQKLHVVGAQLTVPAAGWSAGQIAYNYLGDTNGGIKATNGGNVNVFAYNGFDVTVNGVSPVTAMTITAGADVGIGTSSPVSKFHVNSATAVATYSTTGNSIGGTVIGVTAAGASNIATYASNVLTFGNYNSGGAATEFMRISSSGILQVNTTSTPSFGSPKLIVDGGISGKGTVTINSSTATTIAQGAGLLILVRDTTNGGTAVVSYENATTPVIIATSGGTTFQTGTPSGSAQIQLSNRSGNLGIAALASGDRNGDSLSVTILQAFT
jgi:hypothetical protein